MVLVPEPAAARTLLNPAADPHYVAVQHTARAMTSHFATANGCGQKCLCHLQTTTGPLHNSRPAYDEPPINILVPGSALPNRAKAGACAVTRVEPDKAIAINPASAEAKPARYP
jgi:hypothetical protein